MPTSVAGYDLCAMTPSETPADVSCGQLREALRRAAFVVRGNGPRFATLDCAERLDWARIKAQTDDNDYAVAFLVRADRLGLTG